MYEKPGAPLSIGGVVNDAIRLYRAAFNRAWVPALAMQLLLTGSLLYIRLENPQLLDAQDVAVSWDKLPLAALTVYLSALVVSFLFSNAITAQLLATRGRQELSIRESLVLGARYFLPTLGMCLMIASAGMMATIVVGALVGPLAPPIRALLLGMCAVLAVYLLGRVCLATVALLGERSSVWVALRASWQLTRGNWWRTVATIVTVLVIFIVALFVLSVFAGLINLLVKSGTLAGLLAVQLVAAVIQAFLIPLFNAGFVSTYYDLKLRHGADPARRAVFERP